MKNEIESLSKIIKKLEYEKLNITQKNNELEKHI